MTVFDDVMANAAVEGPFCAVNTQQAGVMVHLSVSALKSQRLTSRREPDGKARIPFQRRGGKVVYAVTDLLEYAKKHNSNGLSAAERTLALLMGEEFCKRIREPWPAHQAPRTASQPPVSSVADEGTTASQQGVSEAPVKAGPPGLPGLAAMFGMFGGTSSGGPRKRGPKSMKAENARIKALEDMGATVWTERCRFASLQDYSGSFKNRFKWLPSSLFLKGLAKDLQTDALALLDVLKQCGDWNPDHDAKLAELLKLANTTHGKEKLLIFTQFADTARYLKSQLTARGVKQLEEATGQSADPTHLAWRFSPASNDKRGTVLAADELRVLIATDVLSEGQNLQDAHIIVNYDLPWAIIRLIQRAGRVDRIGQQSDQILCYSFVPADGVERLIRLRARVRQRLVENKEVVGSDETFFDDDKDDELIRDLYTEKNGILDDDGDTEVDLASYAYQIWKNATDADPSLAAKIETMPNVVYATKAHPHSPEAPKGVLVYMRTSQGNDALAWMDDAGKLDASHAASFAAVASRVRAASAECGHCPL